MDMLKGDELAEAKPAEWRKLAHPLHWRVPRDHVLVTVLSSVPRGHRERG